MVRFPDDETDEAGAVKRRSPMTRRDLFDQNGLPNFRAPATSGIGNISEDRALVGSLLYVFAQLAKLGVRRAEG